MTVEKSIEERLAGECPMRGCSDSRPCPACAGVAEIRRLREELKATRTSRDGYMRALTVTADERAAETARRESAEALLRKWSAARSADEMNALDPETDAHFKRYASTGSGGSGSGGSAT